MIAVGERYTDVTLKRHAPGRDVIRRCDLFTPLPANQFELRILANEKLDLSRLVLPRHVEIWHGAGRLCVLRDITLVCRSRKRWVGRCAEVQTEAPDLARRASSRR